MSRSLPPRLIHQTMHGIVLAHPTDFVKFFRECFGDFAESQGLTLLAKRWTKQGNHTAREVINTGVDTLPGTYLGSAINLSNVSVSSADPVGTVVGTFSVADPLVYPNPELTLIDDAGGLFTLNGLNLELNAVPPPGPNLAPIVVQVQGVGTRIHAVSLANAPDVDRIIGDGLEVTVPNMYRVIGVDRVCQTRRFRINVKDYSRSQSKILPFYELVRIYFPHAVLQPLESDSDVQVQRADIIIDLKEILGKGRSNGRSSMFAVG